MPDPDPELVTFTVEGVKGELVHAFDILLSMPRDGNYDARAENFSALVKEVIVAHVGQDAFDSAIRNYRAKQDASTAEQASSGPFINNE